LKEAFSVADRIGYMNQGHLLQVSNSDELIQRPNCRKVAQFINQGNVIKGSIDNEMVLTDLGKFKIQNKEELSNQQTRGHISIPFKDIKIICDENGAFFVQSCRFNGYGYKVSFSMKSSDENLYALTDSPVTEKTQISISVLNDSYFVFE